MSQSPIADARATVPMAPVAHRVTAVHAELAGTRTLETAPVDAEHALPPARPGQFHMLWAFGVGEVPISVSRLSAAGDAHHTIRAVGATTRALCAVNEGDAIGVRGPFGRAWDLDAARGGDVVVMAGGLGMAPVRPIIDAIVADRESYGRAVVLIGARSPDDLLFADDLAGWRDRSDLDVEITVDHARPGWRGEVGVVTSLVGRTPVDAPSTSAYVCGPEVMMRFAGRALVDHGVPAERIQVSLERNIVCAVAHCGHCQLGPTFICREGPVYPFDAVAPLLDVKAL
jgi:anaerobic sulfite reductase subunit B